MDINDDDNHTVGCAIACCADFLSNSDSDDISDDDFDSSVAETCYPVGLKYLIVVDRVQYCLSMLQKKNHLSTISQTCNNLLVLSDKLKFWTSKFSVRDGDQLIDVSPAARGADSTIPIGLTRQHVPCTGTVYQLDPILFHNPDQEFDFDDVEAKLFALMKSPLTIDGCKLV
jgi:hypothetical protein